MDPLSTLKALGLELPTPAYLVGAIVFGPIDLVACRIGRRSGHRTTVWLGVALMLYPYVVSATRALYAVGAALCTAIYFVDRRPDR